MRAGGWCRCLEGRPDDVRVARAQPPEVDLHLDVRFNAAPMRIALVAGVHPDESSKDWTVVARNGTPTRVLKGARLYLFTRAGHAAARGDARALMDRLKRGSGWTHFVSRVLVEGSWDRPDAVTPVWVIEGLPQPVSVEYYFD